MRLLSLPAALALLLLAAATAHAAWSPPLPLATPGNQSSVMGLAVDTDDRPAVLLSDYRPRRARLTLRRTDKLGRPSRPVTVARSINSIGGEGLFAGRRGDLVAGWLEIVNGSRRPVVATGPRLADRQVLAPGPRSTQFMDIVANRRGDAVVAFWRYAPANQYSIFAAYRRAGGRFGSAQQLATGLVGDPAVAIDERGAAVVSWTDNAGVSVAERPTAAATFSAPIAIASPARPNGGAGVAIENGRAIVSWALVPRSGPNAVLVAERPAAAQPFAAPVPVSVPGITGPRQAPVVVLSGGRALVAWTQRTAGVDRATLAIRPKGGTWQAPIVRGAGATVRGVGLLGPAGARPPLLPMVTDRRGLQTATVRDDGTLAPSRRLDLGPAAAGSPSSRRERTHSWLGTNRNLGSSRKPRFQAVLFGSTP
ncbi:MAG: hypothetical protein QOK16_2521 [Solirubrobacteraceae bacterium]|nr:hypothetical protein [Solirubrobacteraceae bacterium]